jgi:hypothetical protein
VVSEGVIGTVNVQARDDEAHTPRAEQAMLCDCPLEEADEVMAR